MSGDTPVVTLLTDFGSRDPFAGVMKGVILRALRQVRIVDITHEVPPQDVRAGALTLESAFVYFPARTVHTAVVDPGVGGSRRVVAAGAGGWFFLGPDNGLLSLAIARACLSAPVPACEAPGGTRQRGDGRRAGGARVVTVSDEAIERARRRALPPGAQLSATFHGRDVFAPVAALMAGGTDLDELGPRVEDYVRLGLPEPEIRRGSEGPGVVTGEVIHVDHFGNLVTNLRPPDLAGARAPGAAGTEAAFEIRFELKGARISGLSTVYVDRARGELLALVGSTGRIEISVREGSAARELGASVGTRVTARIVAL